MGFTRDYNYLPLANRANVLIAALTKSGFQVEDMMSSQSCDRWHSARWQGNLSSNLGNIISSIRFGIKHPILYSRGGCLPL
ncbi:hypothetical protein GTQ43_39635 [Nostoc sp. KVJ3]|uniref:hypothetical protein n=1 Tax=Nostoc sp. KVJ3 TaxID=457945 RepID=UPI0022377DE6|nr:hypothetical protein [Nostoc sp. KVJ3]MCW5319452.1 hypothetical protein [Nostoc sp. KVJ3]